jgi:hypothetical protein
MGVYRRTDSQTYWMSVKINGVRLRKNTGVCHRKAAEDIYDAWMVQLARERCIGRVQPEPEYTVSQLLAEYQAKVTPYKSAHSQRRDRMVLKRLTTRWGTLRLDALTSKVIEDYITERNSGFSNPPIREQCGGTGSPPHRFGASP